MRNHEKNQRKNGVRKTHQRSDELKSHQKNDGPKSHGRNDEMKSLLTKDGPKTHQRNADPKIHQRNDASKSHQRNDGLKSRNEGLKKSCSWRYQKRTTQSEDSEQRRRHSMPRTVMRNQLSLTNEEQTNPRKRTRLVLRSPRPGPSSSLKRSLHWKTKA